MRVRVYCRGALWAVACMGARAAFAMPCELLPTVAVDSGKVVAAVRVAGPDYVTATGQTLTGLPPFCKVSAVATPTADSLVNIEVWLPLAGWNGRFQGIGNGGYAGTLAAGAPAMAVALRRGFAVANTDMGTAPSSNNDGDAMVGHPQKWEDWGHRATHLMTVIGKQLVVAQYGASPTYSYFNGCSTGGQQALMSAQRYPGDYDGILAGSPANNRTHIHTGMVWSWQAQHATANSAFGSDQTKLVTAAATAACAVRSGGVEGDGFLTDPRTCDWDPGVLQCSSATATGCLSADLVEAARKIYAGPRNPVTGARISTGFPRGAETEPLFGWQSQGRAEPQFGSLFKWVFGLTWQAGSFDFDRDMASVDSLLAPILNANRADLSAFQKRGAKMIAYHGTADPLIPVYETIGYYHRVAQTQHGTLQVQLSRTRQFFRLFVVPGMTHCAGGPGPNAFGNLFSGEVLAPEPPQVDAEHDAMVALQRWVEQAIAPDAIVATKYTQDQVGLGVLSQRPVCAYPAFPRYTGPDPTSASSFVCADNGNATKPAINPADAGEYLN